MLQGRLRLTIVGAATVLALASCGGDTAQDFRPIEQLERTGATAIEQASASACAADASSLRTALDSYALLEREPAPDEAALVTEQYLREESSLWDVRDGQLVPQDPGCGAVPDELESVDIVTGDEAATSNELDDLATEVATMTPDDILADATPDEIAEVGGPECAYEVAEVGLAFARWSFDRQAEPSSLTQLVDDGYLDPLDLWTIADTELVPADGSSCLGPFEILPTVG